MKLGVFSLSLAVKDLQVSKAFYENLGFEEFAGVAEQGWLILKNDSTYIGLFQGMFDKNMLCFNPGWDSNAQKMDSFTDVRDIQKVLRDASISLISEADESTTGPASFMIEDPDANPILIDQHR